MNDINGRFRTFVRSLLGGRQLITLFMHPILVNLRDDQILVEKRGTTFQITAGPRGEVPLTSECTVYSAGDAVELSHYPSDLAELLVAQECFLQLVVSANDLPFGECRIVQLSGTETYHLLDKPGPFVICMGPKGYSTRLVERTLYCRSVPLDAREIRLKLKDPAVRNYHFDEVTVPAGFVVECFSRDSKLNSCHPRVLQAGIYLLWRHHDDWKLQSHHLY